MIGLVQYIWQTDVDDDEQTVIGGYWYAPGHPTGTIDLASVGQIVAARPGESRPVCLATYRDGEWPEADGVLLSAEDARDARPDVRVLDAWESITDFRPQGDVIADLIRDHLTRGADPANIDGPGFLVPGITRQIDLWLANTRIWSQRFVWGADTDYTAKLQAVLTRQLEAVREQVARGEGRGARGEVDFETHQKFADWVCEKYAGKNPLKKDDLLAIIKPATWDEPLVQHETTVTDNFIRAEQTGLGTAAGGWSWAGVLSNCNIASNQAVPPEVLAGFLDEAIRANIDTEAYNHEVRQQALDVSKIRATRKTTLRVIRTSPEVEDQE